MKPTKRSVLDLVPLLLSAALLLGVLTLFAPCGPKEDGSWMNCHWAGVSVAGDAAVLTILSAAHLAARDTKLRRGLSLALLPTALLAALTPGLTIPLCMMHSMRCHTVMTPAVRVCAALILAAALRNVLSEGRT